MTKELSQTAKIGDLKKNCTLVAAAELSNKDEATILAAFEANGYVRNKGCKAATFIPALRKLGLIIKPADDKLGLRVDGKDGRLMRVSLSQISYENPKGTFLVSTRNHVLVMRNGCFVDPNLGGARMRSKVTDMWQITNAKKRVEGDYVKFVRKPTLGGGESRKRRMIAYMFCENFKAEAGRYPTPDELFGGTEYNKWDFADCRRAGRLYLVDEKA